MIEGDATAPHGPPDALLQAVLLEAEIIIARARLVATLDRLELRLAGIGQVIEHVETRLDALQRRVDARLAGLEAAIAAAACAA